MKKCAICGLVNGPDEPTCLACGEASWLDETVAPDAVEPVDADAPEDVTTADASPRAKRRGKP